MDPCSQRRVLALVLVSFALWLGGCFPIAHFRASSTPTPQLNDCKKGTEAEHCSFVLTQGKCSANPYTIVVVEFDDQGVAHLPAQLDKAVEVLKAPQPADDRFAGQLVVAYAHGWFHNARGGDSNLKLFGKTLEVLASNEISEATTKGRKPRRVVGVYLSWRGESWRTPGLQFLTFWNRKETAHRIGERDATVALMKIRDATYGGPRNQIKRNRLVVMGHSFGGALVYSALSQMIAKALLAPAAVTDDQVVADAVILFNPAFEAARLHHLFRQIEIRTGRGPTLSLLTSETDGATGIMFPFARGIDTLFDGSRRLENPVIKDDPFRERAANNQTIGHFDPYITHDLLATAESGACSQGASVDPLQVTRTQNANVRARVHQKNQEALTSIKSNYQAGQAMPFGTTCLVPRAKLRTTQLSLFNIAMSKQVWHRHSVEQSPERLEHITAFLMYYVPFAAKFSDEISPQSAPPPPPAPALEPPPEEKPEHAPPSEAPPSEPPTQELEPAPAPKPAPTKPKAPAPVSPNDLVGKGSIQEGSTEAPPAP